MANSFPNQYHYSKPSVGSGGSYTSKVSIGDTSTLDNVHEAKIVTELNEIASFKEQILSLERQCKDLALENKKIKVDLSHERHKVVQLERQLQFVKDNQMVFEKVREAYVGMEFNESPESKLVEIRDKGVQTWEGILCRACLDTEKIRSELEQTKTVYKDCIIISREDMDNLNMTIQALKGYVRRDEGSDSQKVSSIPLEFKHSKVGRGRNASAKKRHYSKSLNRSKETFLRSVSADRIKWLKNSSSNDDNCELSQKLDFT